MKKVLALVLSLVMVFSMSIAASAASVSPPITLDTIITNDNIYQVFSYLGIDPSKVTESVNTDNETKTYTVKDLKNLIKESRKPSKLISRSNIDQSELVNNSDISLLSKGAVKDRHVWQTDEYSNYWLTYSCYVHYQNGLFTSASHPTIAIKSNALGLPLGASISIDSVSQDDLSFSPKTIVQNTNVTVGHYITIGVGPLAYTTEDHSEEIKSSHYYHASDWCH